MRKITIDFNETSIPVFAGYIGEHNATEITVIRPNDIKGSAYSIAFSCNGKLIHSKFFFDDEEIRVGLWQQLTQNHILHLQLEAFDENGNYIGKSSVAKLMFKSSAHGHDTAADTENSDICYEIMQNTAFRESLEDNYDTLNRLSTSELGNLLFDGNVIEGSGGGGVYVGKGEMPEGCNVQVNPEGEAVIVPTKISQLENDIGISFSENSIPEHWQSALDEGVSAINSAIESAGADKASFLFYTDAHWGYGSGISPKLLKYLHENTAINKVNFGGDFCNTYEIAEDKYMATMREWRKAVRNLPEHHSVIGNHDADIAELKSEAHRYGFLLAPEETNEVVHGNYFHYYIDNKPEKTRYIYLDTGLLSVSDKSAQFTIDTLKSTPDGWHIVVISHIWFTYENTNTPTVGSVPDYCQKLLALFDSYNARTNGSITMNSKALSFDFTSANGWVEFCIGGHTHVDHDFTSSSGIPVILCQTDSYHCRGGYTATEGTTTEASVSGIIADYGNHKITVVRVGRGNGRTIPITVYEVNYTNVLPSASGTDGKIYNSIGYKPNTRWSTSSNNETSGEGIYITGYIPVSNGDIIYLKNITMDKNINGNGCRVLYFSSLNGTPTIQNANNLSVYCDAVWDSEGLLKQFTVEDTPYIRLQADYIGADSVITINEPIE